MKLRISWQVFFWVGYWLAIAYTNSRYDGHFSKYVLSQGAMMPVQIAAAMAGWKWVIQYSQRKKWMVFGGLVLFALVAGFINRSIKFCWTVPQFFPDSTIELWGWRYLYDFFDVLLAMSLYLTAQLFLQHQINLRLTAQLRAEKTSAELHALKNQVRPHFLLNTINNIYALARKQSPQTSVAALRLANLLRFVLYESEKQEVPLESELKIVNDYIDLEKLRFDEDRLKVSVFIDCEHLGFQIPPLLLLPLVENAFKHGAGEQRDGAFIAITLIQKGNQLEFRVKNSLPENYQSGQDGIGLSNLQRQLELLFPGKSGLEIVQTEEDFEAFLWIKNHI
jgi:sensor histidine kinase YesM